MHDKKRIVALGLAVISALLLGAGIAWASIPGPDGVIHGCYKNSTGMLITIDSAASCPTGYTALNWNQTGPAGPAGATGATGPQGPAGVPGVNGVSGYETDFNMFTVGANACCSELIVACSAGKNVVGGGTWASTSALSAGLHVVSQGPTVSTGGGTGTAAYEAKVAGGFDAEQITVTAICVTAS